ncbi:MAG: hypothetical protein EOO07_03000 [Chitinophagaceae bacterium]|nr:MAG: hypothetical protein EOO07_03000 [Chitinophagaceae bacterium]
MNNKIEFKKVREFGDIIGDTFLFIKQNFKPLMIAFLYLSGIFIIAGMISSIVTQLQLLSFTKGDISIAREYGGLKPLQRISQLGLNYIVVIFFVVLTYTSMYVSVLAYIALYIEKGNQAPTPAEVWGYYKYYFFRMMGSGLLMTFFLGLCFMCCIIPGIYVFPAVSLFYVIMIMENGSFSHSFSRSFKLLKDEWWVTAASLLVIYIIFYACTMIIQLPAIIVMMGSAFARNPGEISASYVFISSIAQYVSQMFMIIPIVCSTLIYFNLVERRESMGLLSRINDLGQDTKPNDLDQEQY